MTTPLSPAAQAVLDAANRASSYGPDDCLNDSRFIAAAALRAAVDQVMPGRPHPHRTQLLAIAAELENHQ